MSQKQFIRIEGDAVAIVTERVERTVKLDDLVREMTANRGLTTPMLPLGCRLFKQQADRSIFVIEQAPQVRNLVWTGMEDNNHDGKWKLAFPYVIFVVDFSGAAVSTAECRVFYRNTPLGGADNALLRTNLCNTYQDGGICTGDVRVQGETLAQKAESFVASFWRSRFNADLRDNNFFPAARQFPQVASLAAWQKETESNPLFPLGIRWFEHGKLSDVLERRR